MSEFLSSYARSIKNEGGALHDKDGFTYCGVLQSAHKDSPLWGLLSAIKPLSEYERGEVVDSAEIAGIVKSIYKADYWDKLKGDAILSQPIAEFMFDFMLTSWNMPIKHVQRELALADDGIMGSYTLAALNEADEDTLLPKLIDARIEFYKSLNDPTNIKGWIARCETFR